MNIKGWYIRYILIMATMNNELAYKGRPQEEKLLFFWILSKLPPPPPPKLEKYYIYYILYIHYTTWKQFKVQIIGILDEIDFFIHHKCTFEKGPKSWAGPSPHPNLDKIQKNSSFFLITSLTGNSWPRSFWLYFSHMKKLPGESTLGFTLLSF